MDAVKIGQFLCALRKERRWTQQEAAARLGVTDKSISKWETARGLPDITVLPALAQLYGVTVDELLAGARRPADCPLGRAGLSACLPSPVLPKERRWSFPGCLRPC